MERAAGEESSEEPPKEIPQTNFPQVVPTLCAEKGECQLRLKSEREIASLLKERRIHPHWVWDSV